jgi:hypothetical protein
VYHFYRRSLCRFYVCGWWGTGVLLNSLSKMPAPTLVRLCSSSSLPASSNSSSPSLAQVSLDPPELLSFPLIYDTGPKLVEISPRHSLVSLFSSDSFYQKYFSIKNYFQSENNSTELVLCSTKSTDLRCQWQRRGDHQSCCSRVQVSYYCPCWSSHLLRVVAS